MDDTLWIPILFIAASVLGFLAGVLFGRGKPPRNSATESETPRQASRDRDRGEGVGATSNRLEDGAKAMLEAVFETTVPEHHRLFALAKPSTLSRWNRVQQGDDLVLVAKAGALQYKHIRIGEFKSDYKGTEIIGFVRGLDPHEEYSIRGEGGWLKTELYANDHATGWWDEVRIVEHTGWKFGLLGTRHDNDPDAWDLSSLQRQGLLFDFEGERAVWWEERGFSIGDDDSDDTEKQEM